MRRKLVYFKDSGFKVGPTDLQGPFSKPGGLPVTTESEALTGPLEVQLLVLTRVFLA